MKIPVRLTNLGTGSLAETTLEISYFLNTGEGESIPKNVSYRPSDSGEVTHVFEDDLARDKNVFFALVLRSTSILVQTSFSARDLREEVPVILRFDFEPVDASEPGPVPTPPKPQFIYGRLLEKNGLMKMEDVQIIFEATRVGEDSQQPIATVRTEANGYFFIEYPDGRFLNAAARVGLKVIQNPVPIRLEKTSEPDVMIFPTNVIVVVELEKSDQTGEPSDAGCKELDVHEPKRVLEEYSFYTLVRTTEPEILGYVLEEKDDISLADVLKHHPIRSTEIFDSVIKLPVFRNVRVLPRMEFSTSSSAVEEENDDISKTLKNIKVSRKVLENFLKSENSITKDNVVKLIDLNESVRFRQDLSSPSINPLGRTILNANNRVVWEPNPKLYQSVSVAHGHLLNFKSEWIADGYSLGDLLYSLPLAPGQKKQIVVFDWERRESASNLQSVEYEESLYNSLTRDRDVFEITSGTVRENLSGKSSSTTSSASAGIGGFVGGVLFGVSGGVGHSGSTASQNSLRQTAASDLQKIKDRMVQSANAVRSQRTSVIQTVSQGERFEVSAETVANYNHCHAITIQYFEVLRHFKVRQRLAEARECLLVPLILSTFDLDKLIRWKEVLQANLIDGKSAKGFDAAERVKNQWVDSNFPSGTFASESILNATGNLQISFIIRRPDDITIEVDDTSRPIFGVGGVVAYPKKKVEYIDIPKWQSLIPFLGGDSPKDFYDRHLVNAANKNDVFHSLLGEKIATEFVKHLQFVVADETGSDISTISFDASLNSRYRKGGNLNVSVRFMGPSAFGRDKVHYIKIRCGPVPDYSSITVESGFIRYRTNHYEGFLFRYQSIKDDLSDMDEVILFAGPGSDELRDPRKDDIAIVNRLIDHLNDNLVHYHHILFRSLNPGERFMLLDGIILQGEKGLGRSLASLVENELIGIVGNSLVFPVARGLNLDPNFGLSDSLTDYYMVSASDPISISVPTKGVYAEAMMGSCNSCEVKDETRFWRWEESPIPDSPTVINPISTDTRRAEPSNLQPLPLPQPISIQNALSLPEPTGLSGTLGLLGNKDLFKDITGLEKNQANALEALKASYEVTKAFGQEAAKIEVQKLMERRLDSVIKAINEDQSLKPEQKRALKEKAYTAYLGGGATTDEQRKDQNLNQAANKAVNKAAQSKSGEVKVVQPNGAVVQTKHSNGTPPPAFETRLGRGGIIPIKQESKESCWASVATMLIRWRDRTNYTIEQVMTIAGQKYVDFYTQKNGLPFAEKADFISSLRMKEVALATYTAEDLHELLLKHGPLWITSDSNQTNRFSSYAVIITGMTSDLDVIELVDPSTGTKTSESFENFTTIFSDVIVDDDEARPPIQVIHLIEETNHN